MDRLRRSAGGAKPGCNKVENVCSGVMSVLELEDAIWARVGGNQRGTQVQEMLGFTIPIGEKENLG